MHEPNRSPNAIFTGDNGGVSRFWKGGMNGAKSSVYEGGVRAPFFARWPGVIPAGGVVEAQVSHVDLLPTFCELAGVDPSNDRVLDGRSLVPLLRAGQGSQHQPYVYHTWDRFFPNPDRRWGISDQRWKLVGIMLSYGCRPQAAGGVLEVSAGPSSLQHTVQPTATAEQFARFPAGVLHLEPGQQRLSVRILRGTGNELMRLNAVSLQRVDHD